MQMKFDNQRLTALHHLFSHFRRLHELLVGSSTPRIMLTDMSSGGKLGPSMPLDPEDALLRKKFGARMTPKSWGGT